MNMLSEGLRDRCLRANQIMNWNGFAMEDKPPSQVWFHPSYLSSVAVPGLDNNNRRSQPGGEHFSKQRFTCEVNNKYGALSTTNNRAFCGGARTLSAILSQAGTGGGGGVGHHAGIIPVAEDCTRSFWSGGFHPVNVIARRNERERNRVKTINQTFAQLRRHLPSTGTRRRKLSKVQILRLAIQYIDEMQKTLEKTGASDATTTTTTEKTENDSEGLASRLRQNDR